MLFVNFKDKSIPVVWKLTILILEMKSLEESRPGFTKSWRNEKEHYEKLILKEFIKWKNCKVRNCELTNL